MDSGKSKEQLQAELDVLRKAFAAEGWVQIILTAIRCGTVCVIAYFFSLSIISLAGLKTIADISLDVLGRPSVTTTIDGYWLVVLEYTPGNNAPCENPL